MIVSSNAPWVIVTPTTEPGLAWRVTKITHLTGEENAGRANVFIWLYISGRIIRDELSIQYGWDGQHADEQQQPKKLDKKDPDPSTDIAIQKGMHAWIEVVDPNGFKSDRVSNLHAEIPNDGPGNEWHHHSYSIVFELMSGDAVQPPVEPSVDIQAIIDGLIAMSLTANQLARDLQSAKDKLGEKS